MVENKIRCEADLYGFSTWLAMHLGYSFAPLSLRGFQHGWVWWNVDDFAPCKSGGLDPNLSEYWGILTQDPSVARSLLRRGIFSLPCGLPFISWLRNRTDSSDVDMDRSDSVLYVPGHSNPWNDVSGDVLSRAIEFSKKYRNASILLGGSDWHLETQLSGYFDRVYRGALVTDAGSFERLHAAFASCAYLITDTIGSHICYALHCGMRVGVHSDFYATRYGPNTERSVDFIKSREAGTLEKIESVSSVDYLERRFPGLIISGGEVPRYNIPPEISDCEPSEIASLLGWGMTYECELVRR